MVYYMIIKYRVEALITERLKYPDLILQKVSRRIDISQTVVSDAARVLPTLLASRRHSAADNVSKMLTFTVLTTPYLIIRLNFCVNIVNFTLKYLSNVKFAHTLLFLK